jgi:protein XRP2
VSVVESKKKKIEPVMAKKKKLNKEDYMFKSQKDATLVKVPGDIDGISFMIKDLDNCVIILMDHTADIKVDRCHNCIFFIGPVKSSIFLRNCSNCEISVSCA